MAKEVRKISVDGMFLNTEHYGAMEQEEAVKRMIRDKVAQGETPEEKEQWATSAYEKMREEMVRAGAIEDDQPAGEQSLTEDDTAAGSDEDEDF